MCWGRYEQLEEEQVRDAVDVRRAAELEQDAAQEEIDRELAEDKELTPAGAR